MPPVTYVVLQTGASITNKNGAGTITADSIRGQLRKKEAPELIGTFKHGKLYLALYGYKAGKAGTENKHELPPPCDSVLLFGDAYIAAYSDKTLKTSVSFTGDEYSAFYDVAFGGFEDIDDEDTEYEESIDGNSDAPDIEEDAEEDEEDEADNEVELEVQQEKDDGFIMKGVLKRGGEDCQIEEYSY